MVESMLSSSKDGKVAIEADSVFVLVIFLLKESPPLVLSNALE
jgi:hypothetical protein